MSGGLRSSVKSHLNAKRLTLSVETNEVHKIDETITSNFTALQVASDSLDKKKIQETSIASTSYEVSINDDRYNMPCLPMLSYVPKSIDSYGTMIRAENNPPQNVPSTPSTRDEVLTVSPRRFLFNELKTATWNFHPHNKLGEGGFGPVFKGWFDNDRSTASEQSGTGILIAVKRVNQGGLQGHREWLAELYYLGKLRHPNLVMLLGYCREDDHQLLVYEFMANSSLDRHLYGRNSYLQPLTWILRMKIALGAAKALAFLHSEANVIHGDVKSSNILLDSNFNAKLSDFGFAKGGPVDDYDSWEMGTRGYAAPEYIATGHFTCKSDVYGFGAVILELLSGKPVLDTSRPSMEHNLVEWARPYFASKRRVLKIFDARIEGQYSGAAARKVANLACRCLSAEPKFRPNMNKVVNALEQLQDCSDIQASGVPHSEPRQAPASKSSKLWGSWVAFRKSAPCSNRNSEVNQTQ